MKLSHAFLSAALLAFVSIGTKAQESAVKAEFKVWGNCDMCKSRIEKSAKIPGVTGAYWSESTKLFSLTYDPSKTHPDSVQKKIAAIGHDTEKFPAAASVYQKLPECCLYDRKKTTDK